MVRTPQADGQSKSNGKMDPGFRRDDGREVLSSLLLLLLLLLNSQVHRKPRRAAHRTCAAERGGRMPPREGAYSFHRSSIAVSGKTLSLGYFLTEGNPVGHWVSKER